MQTTNSVLKTIALMFVFVIALIGFGYAINREQPETITSANLVNISKLPTATSFSSLSFVDDKDTYQSVDFGKADAQPIKFPIKKQHYHRRYSTIADSPPIKWRFLPRKVNFADQTIKSEQFIVTNRPNIIRRE